MKNEIRAGIAVAVLLLTPTVLCAAEDPLAGIGQLLTSGRAKEARARLASTRDAYASQHDESGQAISLLLLGMTDYALQDVKSARTDLQEATEKFTAAHDVFGAWSSLWTLSQIETEDGSFEAAVAVHERTLTLLRDAADPKVSFSLGAMKAFGGAFGAENVELLADHPEILKPILLTMMRALTHDGYGHTLVELGQEEKAEQQLAAATEAAAMFGGMFDSSIAAHVGDLRRLQWRLDEAREDYKKALQGVSSMPALFTRDGSIEVRIAGKLADIELLSGNTPEALAWNDRAQALVRAANDPRREAAVLEDRGVLLQDSGRFDEALQTFHHALTLAERNVDVRRQAGVHADLATMHFFEGSYGTALRELEKAIAQYQSINDLDGEAPLWTLLAEVHMMLDAQDSAAEDLDRARALAAKSPFKLTGALVDTLSVMRGLGKEPGRFTELEQAIHSWWDLPETRSLMYGHNAEAILRQTLHFAGGSSGVQEPDLPSPSGLPVVSAVPLMLKGKMLLDRKEYQPAREIWLKALPLNPNRDHRAGILALIGATYWKEGKREEGIRYFSQAADVLDKVAADVKVEELMAGYLGDNRHWYYDLLVDMLVQQGRVDEAFAQAERARARAFLQLVGSHRINAGRGGDVNLMREAELVRARIAEMEVSATRALPDQAARIKAELAGAHQHYAALMVRVKVSNPEYASVTSVEPLQIEDVRKELPPDTTLISYFASSDLVHAWVVDRAGSHYKRLPLDQAGLREIVCWADQFGPRLDARGVVRSSSECGGGMTAERAFSKLIAPLQQHIAHERLIIIPHGVLHYVPFAALRNPTTGHYLIEDYTTTYAPSASTLRFLRAKETPLTGTALVLGDPESALALDRLPGAEQEAIEVAQRLGTTPHLGIDAREALLDDVAGRVDVVHLAAHGIYDPANPLFSRIVLAGDATHDGSLTAQEILSRVDLSGVNLVVLSACRSAAGARTGGDEMVGLTRSLLYAGTPGVISTLWNIDDLTSADLMDELYKKFTEGTPVAEALRQAQIFILHSDGHADPRYWAGFTLNGDPQGCWNRH